MAESKARARKVLTVADLDRILRNDIVKECTNWKDVGIQLDLKSSSLDKIKHDKKEDCMKDMLRMWLATSEEPTLDDLLEAIKTVKDRLARKRHIDQAESDAKRVRLAIHEIEGLIDNWELRDRALQSNLTALVDELKKEETWMINAEQSDKESKKWKSGNDAKMRTNLQTALQQSHGFVDNEFVHEFLHRKGFSNPSKLKDQMIEGMLRSSLAQIDVNRTRILSPRYKTIRKHQQRLKHAKSEIRELKELLEHRLSEYNQHTVKLGNLGAKTGEVKRNSQLEKLGIL